MKFSLGTVVACAGLISPVMANFDLYMVDQTIITPNGVSELKVWEVFEAEPNCNQVMNQRAWSTSNDVSGTKEGIRCVGSGCDYKADIANSDVLEMNFNGGAGNVLHWTLYKDRGRTMVGCEYCCFFRNSPVPGAHPDV
jgi:hypothetical protein